MVSDIEKLSKNKFFNITALGYCLNFINSSINSLDYSKLEQIFTSVDNLPSEWIVNRAYDLISSEFDNYDIIEGFTKATRLCNYLKSQLFIALISELESYFNDVLELVLLAYPNKLQSHDSKNPFNVSDVLQQPNADQLIRERIEHKITNKKYGSTKNFLNFVANTLDVEQAIIKSLSDKNISKQQKQKEISLEMFFDDFVEMKARRDLGVHNGWKRNNIYDDKVPDYLKTIYQGDFLCVDSAYFIKSSNIARDMVSRCNIICRFSFSI